MPAEDQPAETESVIASRLVRQFQELRDYVGWSADDEAHVPRLRQILGPQAQRFVDDFYARLAASPAARRVLTGGPPQIARLQATLVVWIEELLEGRYDDGYVDRRWRVGRRHVEIGVDQMSVGMALARMRGKMASEIARVVPDPEESRQLTATFHKLIDLDQLLIQASYDAELQAATRTERERRLLQLVDGIPGPAVYVVGQEVHLNQGAQQVTGYSRQQIRTLADWERHGGPTASGVSREPDTETGQPVAHDSDLGVKRRRVEWTRPDGAHRTLEVVAFSSETDEVWLLLDVTEADIARLKSMQAQRLALIGQMITTLAHEARNALQRIRISSEQLELELEDRPELAPVLTRLGAAQDDLKILFDEVRNYAAPVSLSRESVCLCDLAESAWDSLVESRRDRQAVLDCGPKDPAFRGMFDRFRIEQVFRNLFENSLAACGDPVQIVVAVSSQAVEGVSGLEIMVRDNGPGMTDEIRERMFEPFFTTKTKGTGLGMAIAERVLTAHGGTIEARSPARGAEFRIWLPLTQPQCRLSE